MAWVYSLNIETVLFQTIHFSISTQFSSIWFIIRTLWGAITQGLSGPGSNGNERILRIPQSSIITGASPSDCLVSYPGRSFGGLTPLQRYSRCFLQLHPTSPGTCRGVLLLCKEAVDVYCNCNWHAVMAMNRYFILCWQTIYSECDSHWPMFMALSQIELNGVPENFLICSVHFGSTAE